MGCASLLTALAVLTMSLGPRACSAAGDPSNPALLSPCHPSKSTPEQCLALMTLNEKIGQMTQIANVFVTNISWVSELGLGSMLSGGGAGPSGAGGVASDWAAMIDAYQAEAMRSRLRIPIIYAVDAVHGHANVYGATVFPHNIALGAAALGTGDAGLAQRIGDATRQEMLATGCRWTFAPCVAVTRDDRWGRVYESFSENGTLVGQLGLAAVTGLQGSATGVVGAAGVLAGTKHYVGDGGAAWGTGDHGYPIDQGDVAGDEAAFRALHLAPYEPALAAGVGSVVVSYNSFNGEKMHGSSHWVTDVLKGELGFGGIVVSDWMGIDQLSEDYGTAVRESINAGLDVVMVPDRPHDFIGSLRAEVEAGRVPAARVDDAVLRVLRAKAALGLWDRPFADRSLLETVGSGPHRALAREAVAKSAVLLENRAPQGQFPLRTAGAPYSVAVSGPAADDIGVQCGGWTISWQGAPGNTTVGTTVLQGIRQVLQGATDVTVRHVPDPFANFTADVGIAVIGEMPYAEGVGDNGELTLSGPDLDALYNVCEKTKLCVAVLISGRPLLITDHLPTADVWVAAWLPGTEGGGIADVLFGRKPFTGRLPVTWPMFVTQEPTNYDDGTATDPLYPIGHGLTAVPAAVAPAAAPAAAPLAAPLATPPPVAAGTPPAAPQQQTPAGLPANATVPAPVAAASGAVSASVAAWAAAAAAAALSQFIL